MVKKYGSKREKFQVAKQCATDEWRLVWEMEQVMDVELFLDCQAQWEEDSPHHLAIMHKMFQHAAAKGQKEVEWIVCWGCQQKLPQLNPEAGILAIQLVGPETSKQELQELYLEVYKLHRLLGSPPEEPALLKEVLSSLEDHQGHEGKRHLQPQWGPVWKIPIPWEAEPPRREMGQLSRGESGHHMWGPPKITGCGSYPWRGNRKSKSHLDSPRSEGEI